MRLVQQATLAARPAKTHRSLEELTDGWRTRASGHVGVSRWRGWRASRTANDLPLLRADDLGDPILTDAFEAVLASVAERDATYGLHNLLAETHRILRGVGFASPYDRVTVAERITDLAVGHSLSLAPPTMHHTPNRYICADGSSRLHPESRIAYTTQALLDAEARLLTAGRTVNGPTAAVETIATVAEEDCPVGITGCRSTRLWRPSIQLW